MKGFGVAVFALALLLCSAAGAQMEERTVTVKGEAMGGPHSTLAQVRRAALDDARTRAVEQVSGIAVTAANLLSMGIERAHFLQTLAHGYVVAEKVLSEQKDFVGEDRPGAASGIRYKVELEATVAVPPKDAQSVISLEAKLNRANFIEGDRAHIGVESHSNGYLYIFNLTGDDRAALLFPSPHQSDNRLTPGRIITVPPMDCGVCLEMATLPGEDETVEAFLVVALAEEAQPGVLPTVGEYVALTELYSRLTRLPIHKGYVEPLPYVVSVKK